MKKVIYVISILFIIFINTRIVYAKNANFNDVVEEMKNSLSEFQDKISFQSDNDSINITFTEDIENIKPLIIDMKLKLEDNKITYYFNNTMENNEYLFIESLIRNLMLDKLIHTVGKLMEYSTEDIDNFNNNIPINKPTMDNYGIYINDEPYNYIPNIERYSDIEVDYLIENINNFGKGNGIYTIIDNEPDFGYSLNKEKSKCKNDSTLEIVNDENNKQLVIVGAKNKDVCEVFFYVDDLFDYNFTLNAGIVNDFAISLTNFNPNYQEVIENPQTGIIIPISIICFCIIIGGIFYYIVKNKRKLYKI